MAYGDFKDLAKRTAADKVLRDKAFNIAKDPKYDGYQRGLASTVYKLFDKKTAGSSIKSMLRNEQLAEELHKPIIRKGFVLKTTYDTDKSDLEKKISDADKKIPDTSELAKKKTDLNAKITEIEGKIPGITGIATNLHKLLLKIKYLMLVVQ